MLRRALDNLFALVYMVGLVNLLLFGASLAVVAAAIVEGRQGEAVGGFACLVASGLRPFVGR